MKFITLLCFVGIHYFNFSQTVSQLKNEENSFIIVLTTSTKCEIYYSNGHYEEIPIDTKTARIEGANAEEMNTSKVIGEMLKYEWKLHSVTNNDGNARFYLTR